MLLGRFVPNFRANFSQKTCTSKWDLFSAVFLERRSVIRPDFAPIELQFREYLAQMEYERSLKNDFELKHELEMKQLEVLRKGGAEDMDISLNQTSQDIADAALEELKQFVFASRRTTADEINDLSSLERKLDQSLVLVVKQALGEQQHFLLPQAKRLKDESLRQTADRILKEIPKVKATIYGNAPCGFYKYKYPKNLQETGTIGAKIFVFFARHLSGSPQVPQHQWLDQKELQTILPLKYHQSVAQLLI